MLRYIRNTRITGSYVKGNDVITGTAFRFGLELGHLQFALLTLDGGHVLDSEEYLWAEYNIPAILLKHPTLWCWLKQEFEIPNSLMRMCRAAIRMAMAEYLDKLETCRQNTDHLLPLPKLLEKFVTLEDIIDG